MTIEKRDSTINNKRRYPVSHRDSKVSRGNNSGHLPITPPKVLRSSSGLRRSPSITSNLNELVQRKDPTTIATAFVEFDDITNTIENMNRKINTIENMNRKKVIVPLYADCLEFDDSKYFNYYLRNNVKLYEESLNNFKKKYKFYNFPNIGVIDFAISIEEKNLIPNVKQFNREIWLVEAYVEETNNEFTDVTIPMLSEEDIFPFRNLELEFYEKEQPENRGVNPLSYFEERLNPLSYFEKTLSTENQWVLGLHCVKKDNGKIDILNLNVEDFDPTNVVALNNEVQSCEVHETFVYKVNVVIISQEDTVVVFQIPSLLPRELFNAKKSELELQ